MMRFRNVRRLLWIVLAATTARVFTLWVGRAEFTGWLNHTYYYFVQVRGLLEQGALPYPDMPLLFLVYATIARTLAGLGMESQAAIVAATRLVMCVVPSLIAVPIFGIVRNVNGSAPVRRSQWMLIASSAFLPLSLSYLPEFLQKNMLGLLLLASLALWSQRLLRRPDRGDAVIAGGILVLIVLAHFGTAGAAALYCGALVVAFALVDPDRRRALIAGLLLVATGGVALGLIHAFDVQRFDRILSYATESVGNSLIAGILSGERRGAEAVLSVAVLVGVYLLLLAGYRTFRRCRAGLAAGDRIFWLANLVFCALLVFPLFDERLMARLALFTSIPLLVVLVHVEAYAVERVRMRTAGAAFLAAGVALLAVGELTSSRLHNANHQAVLADILTLGRERHIGAGDLVIARTGADHVCNWFYRAKAGVITSLNVEDFERFDGVYVLNPLDGQGAGEGLEGRSVEKESDKYLFMRRNVPRPANARTRFTAETLELFELDEPPPEWAFASDGSWKGYSR